MKLYICPECKEVIADGSFSGSNTQCKACASRISRDDLIECDSEDILKKAATAQMSGQNQASDKSQNNASSFNNNGYNNKYNNNKYNLYSENSRIGKFLNKAMNPLIQIAHQLSPKNDSSDNPIPIVHSFEDIVLPKKISREYSNGGTTFIYAPRATDMLIFAIFWNSMMMIILISIIVSFISSLSSEPSLVSQDVKPNEKASLPMAFLFISPFIAVGIGLGYAAINQFFKKNWIEVNEQNIYIESGLSRKYQAKSFPRDLNKTHIICESSYTSNGSSRYYIKIVTTGEEVKIASGLPDHTAQEIVQFFRTLLSAQIDQSGSNTQNTPCAGRINTAALIESDSKDIFKDTATDLISEQNQGFDNHQNNASSFNNNGYNNQNSNMFSTNSNIGNMLNKATNQLLQNNNSSDNSVPIIHSLEDIVLPNKIRREYSNGSITFIYTPKVTEMLLLAIVWNSFTIFLFSIFLISFISDPSSVQTLGRPGKTSDILLLILVMIPFFGAGALFAYISINQFFKKNWIEVNAQNLYIESGLSRKYQAKSFPRDPNQTNIICECSSYSNGSPRYSIKIMSDGQKVKIASDLPDYQAQEIVQFFRTLLCAQIDR